MRGGAPPFELSGRRETRAELIRMRGVLLYAERAAEGTNGRGEDWRGTP
jgi:hypothetical protein